MSRLESALTHLGSLDDLARRDSPATRLDPRIKLVATLAFVVVVASFDRREVGRLAPLFAYPLFFAALGDVPWRPVLIRLALVSPFALGIAVAEPFLDRTPALVLGTVTISNGTLALVTILIKFTLSLAAAILLVATTGFDQVCEGLRRLAIPRVLVSQLMLTYRYLFVLTGEAGRLLRAHSLRAPESRRPTARVAGVLLGQLLLRALGRAERIHQAMRCRGFDGRLPIRRSWRLRGPDAVFLGATLILLSVTRMVDLSVLLGILVTGGAR